MPRRRWCTVFTNRGNGCNLPAGNDARGFKALAEGDRLHRAIMAEIKGLG
jgi:hypothetical protein